MPRAYFHSTVIDLISTEGMVAGSKRINWSGSRIVDQASRDQPHLTSRLEKAAFLMLLTPIVSLGDRHYRIGSEDGLRNYEVLNGHCECSDYFRHSPGHPSMHRQALALPQRLECSGKNSSPPKDSGAPGDPFENAL